MAANNQNNQWTDSRMDIDEGNVREEQESRGRYYDHEGHHRLVHLEMNYVVEDQSLFQLTRTSSNSRREDTGAREPSVISSSAENNLDPQVPIEIDEVFTTNENDNDNSQLTNGVEQCIAEPYLEFKPIRCYQSQLNNLSPVLENRQVGSLYVRRLGANNMFEMRYHLEPSGKFFLVLERDSNEPVNNLSVYPKSNSPTTPIVPLATRHLKFCPDNWLVSPCGKYCVIAGHAKDKVEMHMKFFMLEYGKDHKVSFQKLEKRKCDRLPSPPSSLVGPEVPDTICDPADLRLIAWAIDGKTFVAFTAKMLREQNTIQMYIFDFSYARRSTNEFDRFVRCKLHFNLNERVILYGDITDVCLSAVTKSVVFTTNAYQVFRYNYKAHTAQETRLSPAVTLDGIIPNHIRTKIYLRKPRWAVNNKRENYYICSARAELYHIEVGQENILKKTKDWSLADCLQEDRKVIDFLIDDYSTRACCLLDNGDVLSFDLKHPRESHKVILVNSDLNFVNPRFFINWRTSELIVYSNESFSCHLLPYRQFTLKHLAMKEVIRLYSDIANLDLGHQIKQELQLEMPDDRIRGHP